MSVRHTRHRRSECWCDFELAGVVLDRLGARCADRPSLTALSRVLRDDASAAPASSPASRGALEQLQRKPYRRARVALWHECKDVDLALWLEHLDSLDGLRRAKARALRTLWDEASIGIASHQVDVFILEPGTDRYLGRLCDFNTCPKGKAECRVRGLRRGDAAASARGVQVASGEPGRGPCGLAVRTRDGTAAPCERSATSRGRCWVTGCRTEWGSVSPPSRPEIGRSGRFSLNDGLHRRAAPQRTGMGQWADDEVGVDPPHCAQATPARRA